MACLSLHGWLVLDKPVGITSAQAVARVKCLFSSPLRGEVRRGADTPHPCRPAPTLALPLRGRGKVKIGHAGTLDPFASGVLPLALGEATKTVAYLMDSRKTYRVTARWGEERATDDIEGEVLNTSALRPAREQIEAILPEFTGEIMQAPPIFSALKVAGERAYDLARAGKLETLPPRPVRVYAITLLESQNEAATFEIECGKGTYIRALVRDLGRKIGCLGYAEALRRTGVGKFTERDAISLDKLEELMHIAAPVLHPVASALDDIPALKADPSQADKLRQGRAVSFPDCIQEEETTAYAQCEGQVVALGNLSRGVLTPVRVFNF